MLRQIGGMSPEQISKNGSPEIPVRTNRNSVRWEIERTTHAAITTDSFLALQADRDAARAGLKKAETWADETLREMDAIRGERDSLRLMVEKQNAPGVKAEPPI